MSARSQTAKLNRVLVTRPEAAADKTAQKLIDAGYVPVHFPVTQTVALSFTIPEIDFDALTITSAAVFRHVGDEIISPFKHLPLFAVGEGTAQAAREAGFSRVIEGGGDAVRLAATIAHSLPSSARVLYLAGRVRQPVFEDHMTEAGFKICVCDAYDAKMLAYPREEISAILGTDFFAAVLLYSGFATKAFCSLMQHIDAPFNEKTRFLCISQRVAHLLPAQWQKQALIADHPDEDGIFRLFSKL